MKDSGREGILVFDKESGNLLKRVNPFGEGPEEIKRISSFCLDTYHKKICIFDQSDMKVKMYDFSGSMPLLILLICFSLTWQSWIKIV